MPLCLEVDGRWYVGPENGLFEHVLRQAETVATGLRILWQPPRLSNTFHGRDLFAPVAAALASGEIPMEGARFGRVDLTATRQPDWADDPHEVVYIDHYGNAMTGIRAQKIPSSAGLTVEGNDIPRAGTFSSVSPGQVFCYENANGLMEIAVNQGKAIEKLRLNIGVQVTISFVTSAE